MAERDLMDVVDELITRGENGISDYSELARRMHRIDQRRKADSWRRDLNRWGKTINAKERDIAVIALAFNVKREAFPSAKKPATVAEIDRRLAELEATVGLVEEGETVGNLLEELAAKLGDALSRIEELETESGYGGASGTVTP